MKPLQFTLRYIRAYKIRATLIALALLVLGGMTIQTALQNRQEQPIPQRTPQVHLLHVGEYRVENAIIQAIGEVESLSQVELKSQLSERIEDVRIRIGQRVQQGDVLILLDSTSITAQLAQAQANIQAEQATLQQMQQTIRTKEGSGATNDAQTNLANTIQKAEVDLQNTYTTALTTTQQATQIALDALFAVTDIQKAHFNGGSQDSIKISDAKTLVVRTLLGEASAGHATTEELSRMHGGVVSLVQQTVQTPKNHTAIDAALTETTTALQLVKTLLDTVPLTSALSTSQQATLTTQKSLVTGDLVALSKNIQAIAVQKTTNETAIEAARQAGTTQEQIASQTARVRSTEAALQTLRAQESRTHITAPISGVISAIPVRTGEFATAGQHVASIVNPGSLQVKTYINSADIAFIQQGTPARIEGTYEGSVTRIAPSLDPQRKKVETLVAVLGAGNQQLTIGEFAHVELFMGDHPSNNDVFFIPLQSVRVTPEDSFVYTVLPDNTLLQHRIKVGRVVGDSIEVFSGISQEMRIVFSVRGLEPGDTVEIQP